MYASRLLLFLCVGLPTCGPAQDFGWWNAIHDYDGTSSWRSYLKLSPGFMGPNALPVPEINNGRLTSTTTLTVAAEGHFSRGDDTQNAYLDLQLPLFSDRVSLRAQYVPLEHYHMTTATRDERAARDFDGRGWASGDLYLSTYIQLLRDHARWPDVLLTINLRTATGNKLSAARYTDTPGYFFDVSAGKTHTVAKTGLRSLRPHALLGFYVWQTYYDNHFQNDAFLYGLGVDLTFGGLALTPSLGGYAGYLGEGDKPLVTRLDLRTTNERRLNLALRLQHGLHDFPYTSMRVGTTWRLGK
jgi:hypothetical protein